MSTHPSARQTDAVASTSGRPAPFPLEGKSGSLKQKMRKPPSNPLDNGSLTDKQTQGPDKNVDPLSFVSAPGSDSTTPMRQYSYPFVSPSVLKRTLPASFMRDKRTGHSAYLLIWDGASQD
ncbi:hypothetical protein PCASD_22483 [Puccinia coronata f. sp. avenae]|uniref:Uncharacterized protein n=1 Tax=Puccinia coronata f. sp. avenae TaxID=200324 RepID=A0A2N5TRH4_9BASI|nr:hypothetical protein PCASD_22483 [Puccinia coronata f. sp. avenae]